MYYTVFIPVISAAAPRILSQGKFRENFGPKDFQNFDKNLSIVYVISQLIYSGGREIVPEKHKILKKVSPKL